MREAISATGQADVSQTAKRLWAFLEGLTPGRVKEFYPCLGRVLGVPLEPEAMERLERLDGESLKRHTFRMVQEWVAALAEREPTVLVFEYLYRVDPTSAELLEQILPLAGRAPLLIVMIYRKPGRVMWYEERVEVELEPYRYPDQQRKMEATCARFNEQNPHWRDGRSLRITVAPDD